jgi:threonine dehydratase
MNKEDLIETHERIKPYIHNTPVLTSKLIDEISEANLFFKCENFQKMGAFKMRGATNAVMKLSDEQRTKGVVTHSSGNFAQALSLAAKSLGVKAYIVMPSNAPQVKKDAVKGYGGIIIECEPTLTARENTAIDIQKKEGATFLHPSNDTDVILGQGTACIELLELYPDLDYVFTPVGGGGLIAGTALSAYYFGENCKVIGGEPFEADDAFRSLQSGVIESNRSTNTIADGLKTQLGDKNFPIIQQYVEKIILVTEKEIIDAMRLIWERLKIVCEASCAVALAAVLKEKEAFKNKKIGIIISGGNVDLSNLPFTNTIL